MRWVIVGWFVLAFSVFMRLVAADDWEVRSRYPDLRPGDGKFEAGTVFNPWVATSPQGREFGTITPQYPDVRPNDAVFDAGSWSNPYELRRNN